MPEEIGGERNWDYRFTWIRDASFTLYALLLAGYIGEDDASFEWIVRTVEVEETGIKILYPISPEGEAPRGHSIIWRDIADLARCA